VPAGPDSCDASRLIEQLRWKFPQTSVVVLTMISSPSMINEMYRLGACAVVTKASDPTEFFCALAAARAGRTYRFGVPCRSLTMAHARLKPRFGLPPREQEVVRLFSNGDRVSDIARRLNRSHCTVSAQKSSAMRKLGVRNDQELIALGLALVMLG